ncbi:C40 family peptidase [Nocardia tengchongensis]|uniref:C40 family peptidase n=1 Tax=Nocardia tengchongensis TaxID=2055889 RepID=UPI0036B2A640
MTSIAPGLAGDLFGVMDSLRGLYGAGAPDPARTGPVLALFALPEELAGPFAALYSDARGMQASVADSHAGKDAVVHQAVAVSGDATTAGRGRLTDQIADLDTRIRAITSIADTRFSGPALLDTAQAAITQATRQVDTDTASARRLAAQIVPPIPVSAPKSLRANTTRRRPTRSRRRRRVRSDGTDGGNAVRAASGWLGTPYVWGGGGAGGPSGGGFDCSGLTQYAIAQASGGQVVLPRTTYEQIYSGVRVPVHDIRPGDLVFPAGSFGARGPEHVQLAAGNGMVIEAPSAGSRVKWSRMPANAVVIRVL